MTRQRSGSRAEKAAAAAEGGGSVKARVPAAGSRGNPDPQRAEGLWEYDEVLGIFKDLAAKGDRELRAFPPQPGTVTATEGTAAAARGGRCCAERQNPRPGKPNKSQGQAGGRKLPETAEAEGCLLNRQTFPRNRRCPGGAAVHGEGAGAVRVTTSQRVFYGDRSSSMSSDRFSGQLASNPILVNHRLGSF